MRLTRAAGRPARTTADHAGCWPDPQQALLLRAAAGRGRLAIEAWRSWRAANDPDHADGASQRLLPLLYRNLRAHDVEDPQAGALKRFYKQSWASNQMLFARGGPVISALQEAGVEVIVLKGAALAALDYRDVGARVMCDIDLLVRPAEVDRASAILRGFEMQPVAARSPRRIDLLHADTWVGPGSSLDLHWRAMMHAVPDDDLWDSAVDLKLQDVSTLALDSSDRLLHACVHGAATSNPRPVRWVADCAAIIRGGVDWDSLVSRARRREATLTMARMLGYVGANVEAGVPPEVLAELARSPRSRRERVAFDGAMSPLTVAGNLRRHWHRHRATRANAFAAAVSFPAYLQLMLGYDRRRDLLRHGIWRLIKGPSP